MPTYDLAEQRMAVRVVYDGVAFAGKTTNLRQLGALFAAHRTSTPLYSPADLRGRTLLFDWMQISAGVICGFPLLCQMVSVPGQMALTPRRRLLLEAADVVVYVCDSAPGELAAAARGLELFDEVAQGRNVPLVLQANKQDRIGAIDGQALARALGRAGTPVVEAIASDGIGVVDTFVTAVRTVSRSIQAQVERGGMRVAVRRAESPSEVLARLAVQRLDPEAAAEMLLEEADTALMLQEVASVVAADDSLRAEAAAAAEDLRQSLSESRPPRPAPVTEPSPLERDASDSAGPVEPAWSAPTLPAADVPTGFIWPAHTGRAVVRSLSLAGLEAATVGADGALEHIAHGHVASTSLRARYVDGEAARQALVKYARSHAQLGSLLVSELVLVAQAARDGACWIWTVRRDFPSIQSLLDQRAAPPALMASFGVAIVEALRTSLQNGFHVDLSPDSFGVQQGVLRYTAELFLEPPPAAGAAGSILAAMDAIERANADTSAFVDAVEHELSRRLTQGERARAARSLPELTESAHAKGTERLYAALGAGAEGA